MVSCIVELSHYATDLEDLGEVVQEGPEIPLPCPEEYQLMQEWHYDERGVVERSNDLARQGVVRGGEAALMEFLIDLDFLGGRLSDLDNITPHASSSGIRSINKALQ